MNAAALEAVGKVDEVNFVGPINPPFISWQKFLSKLSRWAGWKGDFSFFSRRRLGQIAREVRDKCQREAALDFFHGFTPWISVTSERPYVTWSDCTFRDYIRFYHTAENFRETDLRRIEMAEIAWLKKARLVMFTSQWAAERVISDYGLDANKIAIAGIFGEFEMPDSDSFAGEKKFVFVSTNFQAKGGPVVLSAFREVRKRFPEASLVIVGDCPAQTRSESGVAVAGFLRKEVPAEAARFRDIMGTARALIHPTKSDIAPLLIVEAGYFGCPAISSRRFAIPELVEDGTSGLLLDDPSDAGSVARAMIWMLENEEGYRSMRQAAWARTREKFSKARFIERMSSQVSRVLNAQ